MARSKKTKPEEYFQNRIPRNSPQEQINKTELEQNIKCKQKKFVSKSKIAKSRKNKLINDSLLLESTKKESTKRKKKNTNYSMKTIPAVTSDKKELGNNIQRNKLKRKNKKLAVFKTRPRINIKEKLINITKLDFKNTKLPQVQIQHKNIPQAIIQPNITIEAIQNIDHITKPSINGVSDYMVRNTEPSSQGALNSQLSMNSRHKKDVSKKKSPKTLLRSKQCSDMPVQKLLKKRPHQNDMPIGNKVTHNLSTNKTLDNELPTDNSISDSIHSCTLPSKKCFIQKKGQNITNQALSLNPVYKARRKKHNLAKNDINLRISKINTNQENCANDVQNENKTHSLSIENRHRTIKDIQNRKLMNYKTYIQSKNSKPTIYKNIWPHQSTSESSVYEQIESKAGKILLVGVNSNLFLQGVCMVQLLCGAVRIDGACLRLLHVYKVFSINDKLITIHTYNSLENAQICKDYIQKHKIHCKIMQNDITCIIKIIPITDPILPLLASCDIRYARYSRSRQIKTISEDAQSQIKIIDSWEKNISGIIDKNAKTIFVYSQMSANKVKFISFLINSLLSRTKKCVYLLDCDMSRSIYTNYAQIALYTVNEFVLGYDYLDVPSPLLSTFIGDAKPMSQSISYVNGVHFLKFAYETRFKTEDSILIINGTDTRNCLVGLVDDIIRITKPDLSIIIEEKSGRYCFKENDEQGLLSCFNSGTNARHLKNFDDMASEALAKISKILNVPNFFNVDQLNDVYGQKRLYHEFHELTNSTNEICHKSNICAFSNKGTHLQIVPLLESPITYPNSHKLRAVFENIKFLSAFVKCPKVGTNCHEYSYLSALVPYKIKLSDVLFSFFGVNLHQKFLKYAFNLNIVGLLYDPEVNQDSIQTTLVDDVFTIKYCKHSYSIHCIYSSNKTDS